MDRRQPEQVERLGHARLIVGLLENRQRLPVLRKCRGRMANIDLPVGDSGSGHGLARWRRWHARARSSAALNSVPAPGVVQSRPDETQVESGAAFGGDIRVRAREFDRPLVVGARQVQRTQCLVGGASSAEERTLSDIRQVFAGNQRPVEMLDHRFWRVQVLRPICRTARPLVRGWPRLGFEAVSGGILHRRLAPIGVQLFQALGDARVKVSPLAREQPRADGFGDQRVAEGELIGRFFDQQVGGHELSEWLEQCGLGLARECLEQVEAEAAPAECRERQRVARRTGLSSATRRATSTSTLAGTCTCMAGEAANVSLEAASSST